MTATAALTETPHSTFLHDQSRVDGSVSGLAPPAGGVGDDALVDFLARAGEVIFGHDDANLDAEKRNLSIAVYRQFSDEQIWRYLRQYLEQWRAQQAGAAWYVDWSEIVERQAPTELAATLLGCDQAAVRRRNALSCAAMLGPEAVLAIKRKRRT